MSSTTPAAAATVALGGLLLLVAGLPEVAAADSVWPQWGGDLQNRRWAQNENSIDSSNAALLAPAWSFSAGGDVSATPAVVGDDVYFPDWAGNLYRVSASTGALLWRASVPSFLATLSPFNGVVSAIPQEHLPQLLSRTTPAVDSASGILVIGASRTKVGGYAAVLGIRTSDGSLVWAANVTDHPNVVVTQSPTIHDGAVYIGTSSREEGAAANASYRCCWFRGSLLKLDVASGAVLWRTYMAPPNYNRAGGFAGNAVWGSAPVVDVARQQVVVSTGNNYALPAAVNACVQLAERSWRAGADAGVLEAGPVGNVSDAELLWTRSRALQQLRCMNLSGLADDNHHNSIVAMDLASGDIRWAARLSGADVWVAACLGTEGRKPLAKCPDPVGPLYDFAQAPMLVKACPSASGNSSIGEGLPAAMSVPEDSEHSGILLNTTVQACRDLLVVGQKSGIVWALEPEAGQLVWWTRVGPSGDLGGMMWGGASDDQRVYVSNSNSEGGEIALRGSLMTAATNASVTDGGVLAALDPWDGHVLWMFANPRPLWNNASRRSTASGALTVANDVVFYPSLDALGALFALKADTGELLGSFDTGASTACGPSVAGGRVFVGSGYTQMKSGVGGNHTVWALTLPQQPGGAAPTPAGPRPATPANSAGHARGPSDSSQARVIHSLLPVVIAACLMQLRWRQD